MPYLALQTARLFYKIDDFTDPWLQPETILFVHGFPETTEAWRGWIPHLAREFRCIRIDRRGFGKSGPVPSDFVYTDALFVDDLAQCIERLGNGPVHVIGGKSGGIDVVKLSVARPDLVRTITIVSTPVEPTDMRGWLEHIDRHGMRSWAMSTMAPRMGSRMPPAGMAWWADLMGSNAASTAHAYARWVSKLDMRPDLGRIQCPVLVISPDSSASRRNREHSEAYRELIPDSEFVVIPGDAYHPAATDADACAVAAREFIRRRGVGAQTGS